jgi:hypothetical protein
MFFSRAFRGADDFDQHLGWAIDKASAVCGNPPFAYNRVPRSGSAVYQTRRVEFDGECTATAAQRERAARPSDRCGLIRPNSCGAASRELRAQT